ncbi:MAG: phosphopentomutase [Oscillospiraceae bacterium]|nr:phosphopentomutase [Oscillospiraceae bacterium]
MNRVFLIVLDSAGVGCAPDAVKFDDVGADTFRSCFGTGKLSIPNMERLGFYNIDGLNFGVPVKKPEGIYGKLREKSMGKDTTIGHWEMAGVISETPLPVFPDGFPPEIIDEFSKATGRKILCNAVYSGTQVIADYGKEQTETGGLIVYTSADSVFQIAAHEDVIPVEKLYEYCETARKLLTGKYGVGRVIARPFTGEYPDYTRTANRHDFSLEPPEETLLDVLKGEGKDVIGVGKINDIFAGRGLTEFVRTKNNDDGMEKTLQYADKDFSGLCFVNLVDFDMVYGHRRNAEGYTEALNRFDEYLGKLMSVMKDGDAVIVTADHGCDPCFKGTDHTREYVPFLMWHKGVNPKNIGIVNGFDYVSETVKKLLSDNT